MPVNTVHEPVQKSLLNKALLWLPLLSFLAIRITHYMGGGSDSLFYIVGVLVSGLILKGDVFLVYVSSSIVLVSAYYIFSVFKSKSILFPLAGLLVIRFYILFSFRGLFNVGVYMLSSAPYFISTGVFLFFKFKHK